jgi:acetate kinase
MGGLNAVIFTAGVGENNPWIMKRVAAELKGVVSRKVKFLIIPTNEELLIAHDTYDLIKKGD